jgi:hypothetical protein
VVVGTAHSVQLDRAEGLLVELDCGPSSTNRQLRSNPGAVFVLTHGSTCPFI